CDSEVGNDCAVGPNAHLRQHAVVGNNCRIGNFVEIKNSYLGDFTKASHLAYIGDATVGKRVNIGCGVVFVNFNGREKNHTTVGDNCFLGCNVNLIAPVTLENNCFVAAGTTVDGNLRKDEFAIGRAKMTIKPNRADKYIPFDN
ncbi:MAG: DapH/DapD/GlmU-related protein, partial [Clostridia bacterium]